MAVVGHLFTLLRGLALSFQGAGAGPSGGRRLDGLVKGSPKYLCFCGLERDNSGLPMSASLSNLTSTQA